MQAGEKSVHMQARKAVQPASLRPTAVSPVRGTPSQERLRGFSFLGPYGASLRHRTPDGWAVIGVHKHAQSGRSGHKHKGTFNSSARHAIRTRTARNIAPLTLIYTVNQQNTSNDTRKTSMITEIPNTTNVVADFNLQSNECQMCLRMLGHVLAWMMYKRQSLTTSALALIVRPACSLVATCQFVMKSGRHHQDTR